MNMPDKEIPLDYQVILGIIEPGSTVLDLGCGEGGLLSLLSCEKNCRCQGIEINNQKLYKSVAAGLSVLCGDIDSGLAEYSDKSFDYVILNQSLQEVKHVENVIIDALRAGNKAIIGVPNFAYIKARFELFFGGRTPVTGTLPRKWHDTPNIRFLSLKDFREFCAERNIVIEKSVYANGNERVRFMPNLFADIGIFLISR